MRADLIGDSTMLAQFRSLYPQGSIISELVQIFQGKYIVRVSIQIEGVTRATGMAASETLELAEDQARSRALMVLGLGNAPVESVAFPAKPVSQMQINSSLNPVARLQESSYSSAKHDDFVSGQWSAVSSKEVTLATPTQPQSAIADQEPQTNDSQSISQNDTYKEDFRQQFSLPSHREAIFDTPVDNVSIPTGNQPENPSSPGMTPGMTPSNVTPFTPRSYASPEDLDPATGTTRKKKKSTPVDLSDVIAKTDVELQRLGWTPEQGREHLIKTYGKRGRTLLTEEELYGFLKYLESQPTPIDPLTGF